MNKQTVGTCGNCGGRVSVDTIYWSVVPPRPQCERCGSFAAEDYGPVISMEPKPVRGASNKWFEVTVNPNTDECVSKTTFFPASDSKTTNYQVVTNNVDEATKKAWLYGTWDNCSSCNGLGIVEDPHHGHAFKCTRCTSKYQLTHKGK